MKYPKLRLTLIVLSFMILTLMALGAGVRTMNAGLSCPDWPLCFGQVIPDFHPAVWFEFVHRAYAGLVALVFLGACVKVFGDREIPKGTKRAAIAGLIFLTLQIVMGGLTVLLLVKSVVVTMHLMLATLFFCSVIWMIFSLRPVRAAATAPRWLSLVSGFFSWAVLAQIAIGGFVASTYAGSVCVDWPLCNGQWVPTWQGAIGLQIIHRFVAYALAVSLIGWAIFLRRSREPWMTAEFRKLGAVSAGIVLLQVAVGVANLLLYIPPSVTVIHQSVAVLLLATQLRTYFVARAMARDAVASPAWLEARA